MSRKNSELVSLLLQLTPKERAPIVRKIKAMTDKAKYLKRKEAREADQE